MLVFLLSITLTSTRSQSSPTNGWSTCPDDLDEMALYLNVSLSRWDYPNNTCSLVSAQCRNIINDSYHAQIVAKNEISFSYMIGQFDMNQDRQVEYFLWDNLGYWPMYANQLSIATTITQNIDTDIRQLLSDNNIIISNSDEINVISGTILEQNYGNTYHIELSAGSHQGIVISFFIGPPNGPYSVDLTTLPVFNLELLYSGTGDKPTFNMFLPIYKDDMSAIRQDVVGLDSTIRQLLIDADRGFVEESDSIAAYFAQSKQIENGGELIQVLLWIGGEKLIGVGLQYYVQDLWKRQPQNVQIINRGWAANTTPAPFVIGEKTIPLWRLIWCGFTLVGALFMCAIGIRKAYRRKNGLKVELMSNV